MQNHSSTRDKRSAPSGGADKAIAALGGGILGAGAGGGILGVLIGCALGYGVGYLAEKNDKERKSKDD